MAAKKTTNTETTEVLEEVTTPKAPAKKTTKKEKVITEPEPKTLEEIDDATQELLAETPAEPAPIEEPEMTIEEKVEAVQKIDEKVKEINEVIATKPEEGMKMIEKELEKVKEVRKKVEKDNKHRAGRVIYSWNGIMYE